MPGNTKVTLILDGEKNDFTMENDSNILDEALSMESMYLILVKVECV